MVVAFAYGLALITVYLLLARYEWGLYSLTVLIPFIEMLPASPVPGINSVTVLVGLGLVLALKRERVVVPRTLSLGPPIIALLLITLVSWAGVVVFGRVPGYDVLENLFTIKRWFTFILLYFIFLRIRESESVWDCLGAVWLGVSLEALVAFYQYKTAFTGRLRGTIGGNQNDFGAFLALYMIVGIVLFLQEHGKGRKIAIGAGLGLAGFGIVYSLSRGAYVTFFAAMVVFMYFRTRRAAVVIGALVGSLVLLGVNVQSLFPSAAVERVEATYEGRGLVYVPQLGMELEVSAASRIFYAQAAFEMIKESPIWGVGFGTFVHRVQGYLDPSIYHKRNVAHNMFLQITSEMGLLGFAAFVWIIVRAMRVGLWLYRYADRDTGAHTLGVGLIAITVGLIVTNLFGNRFFNGMIVGYYFVIVALATRLVMTLQEEGTAKDVEPQGGIDTWARKPSTLPA